MLGSSDDYVASDEGFANVAAERYLGRMPVLLVRMNADLLMGEELKKTGTGNLFTVFGEPDIDDQGGWRAGGAVLQGVDVYDPNTGEVRSNGTDQVALWMIDTDYNERVFFVRHCYFTGGQDPYNRLKPHKGRHRRGGMGEAVPHRVSAFLSAGDRQGRRKVINDYGDEVMKVFSV